MLEKGTCFIVDEWRFVPNEGQIFFADETVNIDRRLSKLLEFFCQYPGQTHTRDELIEHVWNGTILTDQVCLLYTSPSPRDRFLSRMPSSA